MIDNPYMGSSTDRESGLDIRLHKGGNYAKNPSSVTLGEIDPNKQNKYVT